MKRTLAALVASLWVAAAAAGNAAPMGFELGVATYEQVKSIVAGRTRLQEGHNGYSGGKMLLGSGAGLGIADLVAAAWVFDKERKLVATIFTLAPGAASFQKNFEALAGRYALKEKRGGSGTKAYALFESGGSLIELASPAEGGGVTVGYITKQFMATSRRIRDADTRMKNDYQAERG